MDMYSERYAIKKLVSFGVEKQYNDTATVIDMMKKRKREGKFTLSEKIDYLIYKRRYYKKEKRLNSLVKSYFSAADEYAFDDSYLHINSNSYTDEEKLAKVDETTERLTRALKLSKKILRQRNLLDKMADFAILYVYYVEDAYCYGDTYYEKGNLLLNNYDVYKDRKDYYSLIKKYNDYIKNRIAELKEKKNTIRSGKKSVKRSNKSQISIEEQNKKIKNSKKIKNFKFYKPINFTKSVLVKEFRKAKEASLKGNYNSFSMRLKDSLFLIQNFTEKNISDNLINDMSKLKVTVAQTIAYYLDADMSKSDIIDSFNYDLSNLIALYSNAYKIFLKQLKKLPRYKKEQLILEYNQSHEDAFFNEENYAVDAMLELANDIIIDRMIVKRDFYSRSVKVSYYDDILESSTLIINRAKYMSLEKVGEAYRKIDEKYQKEPVFYSYPYELQQNFIWAIYVLMIQRKMIDKEQKLTQELQLKICEKYLKTTLIYENIKSNEKEEKKY